MDKQQFRDTMARLGAAISIVTSNGEAGLAGCTVSAICSVTDDPPTLLICLNRASRNNSVFRQNGRVCVNILAAQHEELARAFSAAEKPVEDRFASGAWAIAANGCPLLQGASASVECDISEISEIGSHSVFFCRVTAARTSATGDGLIYFGRAFYPIGPATLNVAL